MTYQVMEDGVARNATPEEVAEIEARALEVTPVPAPVRRMTVLAFRNRFTAVEKAMIEMAAIHKPTDTFEKQVRAASIRAYLADVLAAKYIQPDRPETRGGIEVLEYWGLLDVGRAAEILDAPIQEHELP